MPKAIGRQIQVGVARETSRGTPEAAATFWPQFSEAMVDERVEHAESDQSLGVIEDANAAEIVKQYADINIKLPVGDKSFPLFLYSALGALATGDNADTDPSVKDHTISVAQSVQHQALSVFIDDPAAAQDYKHGLGMIDAISIVVEQGKHVMADITMRAKKGATATLTPSSTTENRFLSQHVTVKLATNQAGLDAAGAVTIKGLTLNITKNLEDDDVIGSADPADFNNKHFTIEGSFEANWDAETYKTLMQAATVRAMRIDLKNTAVTIGSAASPQIKIDLHKVVLKELTRAVRVNDIVRQTLGFKAYYNTTDGKMVTIIATNTTASY